MNHIIENWWFNLQMTITGFGKRKKINQNEKKAGLAWVRGHFHSKKTNLPYQNQNKNEKNYIILKIKKNHFLRFSTKHVSFSSPIPPSAPHSEKSAQLGRGMILLRYLIFSESKDFQSLYHKTVLEGIELAWSYCTCASSLRIGFPKCSSISFSTCRPWADSTRLMAIPALPNLYWTVFKIRFSFPRYTCTRDNIP